MASKPPASEIHRVIDLLIDNLINIRDDTGQFLLHLKDGRTIQAKCWNGWEWTHGIGLAFTEGGTTKNINTMSAFLTLAYVYEKTGNLTYFPWLDAWGEWAMHELPRTKYGGMQHITYVAENDQELWDDTLMMTVMPLAKMGKLLNRPEYIAEAKRQCLIHVKYLFDTKTGLFFHGWRFESDGHKNGGHNFADARWARGNSWCTIVIPEILELLELEPSDPIRIHLCNTLEAQCEALQRSQSISGAWHTLIDHPDSYLEASATAGFAYGILKAVRRQYIGSQYRAMGEKAISSVLKDVDEKGELQNTSFGTPMGHDLQFYKDIPLTAMPITSTDPTKSDRQCRRLMNVKL
ncbi:Six-hairpin glycosidase-like protein [Aspergillus caelatus]|uniref:Six-hairpin glycosidase-like protein n=1 Tax=Aspergillus caelatus TaxID=61420 RepID=A0A5N7AK02_9EURO|nr:Six-hairpin glycosidase-like protein [Aspergillus caelatus]KAE8369398.1 Six-hairpin glycosidase-like protein [Aspergillus caelatus]